MKNPLSSRLSLFRSVRFLFAAAIAALVAISVAQAGNVTWNGTTTPPADWNTGTNWVGSSAPSTTDTAVFSSTNSTQVIRVYGSDATAKTIGGLVFSNTGTTAIEGGNAIGGGANTSLTIGSGGITMNAGSGNVTLGNGASPMRLIVYIGANQTWANNSNSTLTKTGGGNNVLNLQTYTLTISGSGNTAIGSAVISGNGSLIKSGAGTLSISATNTYTGGTTVSAGNVTLAGSGNFGTGSLTVSGGTLNLGAASFANTLQAVTGGVINGGTFTNNGGNYDLQAGSIGSVLAGTNGLNKTTAGSVTLSGNNTYSGATTVTAGTLTLSSILALQNSALNATSSITGTSSDGLKTTVTTLTLGGLSGTKDLSTLFTTTSGGYGSVTKLTLNPLSGTASYSGVIANGAAGMSLTKSGAGTQTLSGNNTYTGATTIGAGTLSVGTINNGGTAGNLGNATSSASNIVFDGGTLQYTGANATSDRAFTINAGKTATIDTANNISLAGATGAATTGALTKIGTGVLTLTGNNTYTGATTVAGGTLKAAAAGALGSTSGIMINTGGTLLVSANASIGSTSNITMNSTTTGDGTAASLVFSSSYNGTVGNLTLSTNAIFDLGADPDGVKIHFSNVTLNGHTLSIYNWTGTTLWGGGDGNNTDQIYAGNFLDAGDLARVSFYSGLASSSFIGNGYQITSGSFINELGPVPEPSTWIAMAALAFGGGLLSLSRRKHDECKSDKDGGEAASPPQQSEGATTPAR